jgi:UDP-2,4-diacetamido-2,4,6-trideoxy-beta-L-altropyranose hydrolase
LTIILFKCAIGKVIGSGHLMRCLTLADALAGAVPRAKCKFWVPEAGLDFPALKNSPYEVVTDQDYCALVDLLIIDDYELDIAFESTCRAWAKKILVIDDLPNRAHDCDIFLDQTYGREPYEYKGLLPDHAIILCGTEYALLRPEFGKLRSQSLRRRQDLTEVKTILVSMGSMNLYNISTSILEAFHHIEGSYEVTVVLSSHAPDLDKVLTAVNAVNSLTQHYCQLSLDATDMARLMADNDFSVGAGGTTSWERACLGLASAVVELAENQSDIIKFLVNNQASISLGHHLEMSPMQTGQTLQRILNSNDLLKAISETSADICDGLGVKRVVEQLKGLNL